jgi:hypothetical protein
MRLPRLDVNQNSSIGGSASAAACAELKDVSADQRPLPGLTRPASCGMAALAHTVAITGDAAGPPTASSAYDPASSGPTSETAPLLNATW